MILFLPMGDRASTCRSYSTQGRNPKKVSLTTLQESSKERSLLFGCIHITRRLSTSISISLNYLSARQCKHIGPDFTHLYQPSSNNPLPVPSAGNTYRILQKNTTMQPARKHTQSYTLPQLQHLVLTLSLFRSCTFLVIIFVHPK